MDIIADSGINAALIAMLEAYGLPIVFLSVLFFGEVAIIASFMLATQGWFPFMWVFALSWLAMLVADVFWFGVGRLFPHYVERLTLFKTLQRTWLFKNGIIERRLTWILLFVKFLYGLRWATILYIALHRVPLRRFIPLDALGTLAFIGALGGVGYAAGLGVESVLSTYHAATVTLSIVAVALVLSLLLRELEVALRRIFFRSVAVPEDTKEMPMPKD